jgi:LAO/AO transport system kinase
MDGKKLNSWKQQRKERRAMLSSNQLFEELLSGNSVALSSAITLIESKKASDQEEAQKLIEKCLRIDNNESIRVGITGVPGVGKSTFIESFGLHLIKLGHRVAVLAVDPTSEKSGGSILGDKTRMNELSQQPNAFIRPSAAGKSLGGVARKTRETIILCEAAGYDYILVETVGVGQSETMVHSMVDFFLLLMLSGAGDELQGIKRGIMEMADALIITKADGDNLVAAQKARIQYKNAMQLFPKNENGWLPRTMITSALENSNMEMVYDTIASFQNSTKINGHFKHKRENQDIYWLQEAITEQLLNDFYQNQKVVKLLGELKQKVLNKTCSPFNAADLLLYTYKSIE